MFGIKWHWESKDGGVESHVWAYGLEIKWLFSVLALRFEDGSRDAYHSHAFDCVSWVLRGELREHALEDPRPWMRMAMNHYRPSWSPVVTRRSTLHKVNSVGRTWVLTFRGSWADTWREWAAKGGAQTLTHGRREIVG